MTIVTDVRLYNGCNQGEVWLQVKSCEVHFDEAGLLFKVGQETTQNQLLSPINSLTWQAGNAS